MDDKRCDCLFSRSKPQFLGAVNVDSGIPTQEPGNEEWVPAIPAKISPSFPQNTPSFPRRRESITEQPILNGLTRRGLCMHSHAGAWERGMGSCHSRKGLPVIPAKLPVIPAKAGIHNGATDP